MRMVESVDMRRWSEQQILDRLRAGWVLEGDLASDEPFVFIYPLTHRRAKLPFPTVPSSIVHFLAEAKEIIPAPGQPSRYWKLR
jgi:hypothetical protein